MQQFYSHFISKTIVIVLFSFICLNKSWATINVSSDINQNTIWTKNNSPYVLTGTVTVLAGVTLSIEPGVIIQINRGSIQLLIQGTLNAVGKNDDSIIITSSGDFRGNEQYIPLYFDRTSTNSILQYAKINNLGFYYNNDEKYAIYISSTACKILNSTLGITRGTTIGIDENAKPIIANNNFISNGRQSDQLDIVAHPDELKNIYGNDSLKIGLYQSLLAISETDTLKPENYFYRMIRSIAVPLGKTFYIFAGTSLQINSGSVQLTISGTLNAVGLNNKNIYITKYGDFRGNDQFVPIDFEPVSSRSVMRNVRIDNLGFYYDNDYKPAIFIRTSSCTIDSCNLQGIRGSGIMIGKNAKPIISNTNITSTYVNIVCDPDKLRYLVNDNRSNFGGSGCTIGITDSVPMSQNDTLYSYHVSYKLLNPLTVPKTRILTIDQKAKLFIPTGAIQLTVQGTLLATGTENNYVQISRLDDFRGNDQVVPIVFDTSSQNSFLHYLSIDGFGYYYNNNNKPSVLIKSSSCSFVNTIFQNSRGLAIKIENASPTFLQSCFYSNINGAVVSSGGTAIFKYCNFLGNTTAITNISTNEIIVADSCYWGDGSGPLQTSTNPAGVGDEVSNGVIYNPYTEEAYDCGYNLLPLTLFSFQTVVTNGIVNCLWKTSTETNTSYFIVQHSINGTNFTDLGKVYAASNSNTSKDYSFTDKSPNNGINYYRLQMVDKDGKFTYSKILPINISISQSMSFYPNPAKDIVNVQTKRDAAEKVLIQIVDMRGNVLTQRALQLSSGTTTQQMNVSALARGSYFLVVRGQTTERKVFIKE